MFFVFTDVLSCATALKSYVFILGLPSDDSKKMFLFILYSSVISVLFLSALYIFRLRPRPAVSPRWQTLAGFPRSSSRLAFGADGGNIFRT